MKKYELIMYIIDHLNDDNVCLKQEDEELLKQIYYDLLDLKNGYIDKYVLLNDEI